MDPSLPAGLLGGLCRTNSQSLRWENIFHLAKNFPSGWGKTDPCGSTISSKLMEADVTVVSDADCAAGSGLEQCSANPATLSYSGKITAQMLCASATGG